MRAVCVRGVNRSPYLWHQADVDVAEVLPLHLELELPEGLDEGHALDVSHRASQLLTHTTTPAHRNRITHPAVLITSQGGRSSGDRAVGW